MWTENVGKLGQKEAARLRMVEETQRVLRLSPAGVRELALTRLNAELEHASLHSPFYSRWASEGRLPRRLSSLAELARVPFTTKDDLRAGYPFGFLAVPKSAVVRYGESTGTTGTPTASYVTHEDWERSNVWSSLSYAAHFSPEDVVFLALPYELAFAGIDVDRSLWDAGATVVAVGALNMVCPWPRVVKMLAALHPSVIVCSPTRALRLYDMLLDDGFEPRAVGLRMLFYTGETCSPAKLRKLAGLWGVELLTAYGTTETNTLSLPCPRGDQHLSEDRYCFEVVDPATGQAIPDGSRGELVLTSLVSQAMPLIRYRTGDCVAVDDAPCACGLPFRRLQHFGRYDEMVRVRGRGILKHDLEEVVLSTEGTGCYYGAEVADDRIEVVVEVTGGDRDAVLAAVEAGIRRRLGVEAVAQTAPKELFCKAMDTMLKPGGVSLRRIRELAEVSQ